MNIHEYQAKEVLRGFGVAVPEGGVAYTPDEAVKVAEKLGPGHTIVTMLCDDGSKYQSRLYNPEFLKTKGLVINS